MTVEQRARAVREIIDVIQNKPADIRLADSLLPSVMWALRLTVQLVLYLEITRYRATYHGILYLRVSRKREPKRIEALRGLFDK